VSEVQAIGTRHDGSVIAAPFSGLIVFPIPTAEPGHEWFYLARSSTRLG
jgi:hypothetical protein